MKVTLINPPSPFLIDQRAFPPLGILYLAAVLEKNDYDVDIIELAGRENELEQVLTDDADIFGITSTTPQYPYTKKIKDILKSYHRDSKIVIGGAHPSSVPKRCIEEGFDHVVVGEGEHAILKIVHAYEENEKIPPIVRCPYIKNIDSLPFPARHLVDLASYGYDVDSGKATTIITSRGCPFRCAFCSKDVWQRGVRYHSPEYVIDELQEVISKYNFRHFLFLDDSMALDKKRLYRLCELMEPLDIRWRCYTRAKGMDKKLLQKMKDAGCVEIGIGVESGSKKILDIVDKGTDPKQNLQFVRDCKEIGIKVNAFIMIGLPGETCQTVEETKRWMEEARPDKFGFNIFAPYVGTPIYNNPDKYDIVIHDMPEEDSWVKGRQGSYKAFVSTSKLSSDEILRLFYELFEYYSNLTRWQPGVGWKED